VSHFLAEGDIVRPRPPGACSTHASRRRFLRLGWRAAVEGGFDDGHEVGPRVDHEAWGEGNQLSDAEEHVPARYDDLLGSEGLLRHLLDVFTARNAGYAMEVNLA
jgi:hypothetical protein